MKTENAPTKTYALLQTLYASYGIEDNTIDVPQPFVGPDFTDLRESHGIDPDGFAKHVNSLLAENIRNNVASRAKAAHRRNETLAEAQANGERTDEDGEELPDQSDVDELVEAYDFSGIRTSSGESAALTPFQKELARLVRQLVRNMLKKSGFQGKPAPVSVAKKGDTPTASQISSDDFAALVEGIVNGEGPWGQETTEDGSPSAYYIKRQELIEQAEVNLRAIEMEVQEASLTLEAA